MIARILTILVLLVASATAAHGQCALWDKSVQCDPNGYAVRQLFREGETVTAARTIKANGHGQLVYVNSAAGPAFTITLDPPCDQPPVLGPTDYLLQRSVEFKDTGRALQEFPITLSPPSGTIDGDPTFVMDAPGMSVEIQWTGTTCKVVSVSRPVTSNELSFDTINATKLVSTTVATTQLVGATTLIVASASGFASPPFVAVTGDEQQQVTAVGGTNNTTWTVTRHFNGTTEVQHNAGSSVTQQLAQTTLNGGINNSTTTVVVANAANFPGTNGFVFVVEQEQFQCTSGCSTNTWTVATRGTISGTAAASHTDAQIVRLISPSTTLGAGYTAGGTAITLTSASGFPATCPYMLNVDSEHFRVNSGCGTTSLNVTGGQNGTTPSNHSNGAVAIQVRHKCLTIPANAYLDGPIIVQENGGGGLPAGLDIGAATDNTALGASNVYQGLALTIGAQVDALPLKRFFSNSSTTTVCVVPHALWNLASATVRIPYRKRYN